MCPRSTARFPSRRRGRATGRRRRRHAYVLRRWQGDLIRGKPHRPSLVLVLVSSTQTAPGTKGGASGRSPPWLRHLHRPTARRRRVFSYCLANYRALHTIFLSLAVALQSTRWQRRNPEQICCFWHSPLVTARIFFTSRYYVETVSYSACVAVPSGRRLLSPQFIENFLLLLSVSGRRVDVRNDPSCDSKFSSVEE